MFSPGKGNGQVTKKARIDPPIPERPNSNAFTFPIVLNADGKPAQKVPLFFKIAGNGSIYVVYGIKDNGEGAYFTPFREVANDDNQICVNFRNATGCHASYVNLTTSHEDDQWLKGTHFGKYPIQAAVFFDPENNTDTFLEHAIQSMITLISDYPSFTNKKGLRTNYAFDKILSNDTHRYHNDVSLPLDHIIDTGSVQQVIYYNWYNQLLDQEQCKKDNKNCKVAVVNTENFYNDFKDYAEMLFSKKNNGEYDYKATNNFGYPKPAKKNDD